jgi:hypothetical protein
MSDSTNGIASTLKSFDTEERLDLYFYRPAGYLWARLFRKLGVSPNAVTLMAMVLGVAAGICFYSLHLWVNLLGMGLLVWANMYDSADGQLARMTGRCSPLGRMLDGFCGDLWFVSIYAALCLRLMPQWDLWIWGLGAVAGYCHTRQAAMADYYRNVHLHFLKGTAGSELSRAAVLEQTNAALSWKKDFFLKLGNKIYQAYTLRQEQDCPHLQELLATIRRRYPVEAPDDFRQAFRRQSLPLMKYTNILSFNTRVMALFISLGLGMPWLYFVFEATVLNGLFVYMVMRHERFSAAFANELNTSQKTDTYV